MTLADGKSKPKLIQKSWHGLRTEHPLDAVRSPPDMGAQLMRFWKGQPSSLPTSILASVSDYHRRGSDSLWSHPINQLKENRDSFLSILEIISWVHSKSRLCSQTSKGNTGAGMIAYHSKWYVTDQVQYLVSYIALSPPGVITELPLSTTICAPTLKKMRNTRKSRDRPEGLNRVLQGTVSHSTTTMGWTWTPKTSVFTIIRLFISPTALLRFLQEKWGSLWGYSQGLPVQQLSRGQRHWAYSQDQVDQKTKWKCQD